MSFRKRDLMDYGCCSYLPMSVWAGIPEPFGTGELTSIEYLFHSQSQKLEAIFKDIYIAVDELQSDGETQTAYYNIGMDENHIRDNFMADFGELPLMRPYYPDSNDGNKKSIGKILAVFKALLEENEYKYRKLAQSLGFIYNPIQNYNMEEEAKDEETPTGTETTSHTVNANKIGSIEVSGPAENIQISEDQETGLKTVDFDFDEDRKIGYSEKSATDMENGQKASGSNQSLTTGTQVETKTYTTTNDDASTGRLLGYEQTNGTVGQLSDIKGEQDKPVMAKITAGAPNFPSYTDTKSFTTRKTTKDHNLSRSGNIGVMSTQDMINQERQVVRFSLLREFFEDLVERICLQTWD